MSTSQLEIIRRACFNSGNGTIDTLDDNSEIARATQTHYEAIVEDMITSSSPQWAEQTRALTALSLPTIEQALTPWTAIYEAPADMIAVKMLQDDAGQRIDHKECSTSMGRGIAVICATGGVNAIYTARAPESVWPADFAMAVQMKMEAVFLKGIAEQRDQGDRTQNRAEMKEQRARVRDRGASTPADPSEWDLTRARASSQRWNGYRAR